jgi:hypothetical protein
MADRIWIVATACQLVDLTRKVCDYVIDFGGQTLSAKLALSLGRVRLPFEEAGKEREVHCQSTVQFGC